MLTNSVYPVTHRELTRAAYSPQGGLVFAWVIRDYKIINCWGLTPLTA